MEISKIYLVKNSKIQFAKDAYVYISLLSQLACYVYLTKRIMEKLRELKFCS